MAKMRSPNYPAVGLGECLQRVRSLWAKEKKTAVDAAVAAAAIGYSGLSGPSRTALSSMKKYGLVDSDDRTVRVSDLALKIIHPASEQEELTALQEAALSPELFRQLFETHRDASDAALWSYLINKLGFSVVGAKQLVKAFRDTMIVSKLDMSERFLSQAMLGEDQYEASDNEQFVLTSKTRTPREIRSIRVGQEDKRQQIPHQTFSWPLSPGVTGEVRIIGDEPKAQHLRAICRYLQLAEQLMEGHGDLNKDNALSPALAKEERAGEQSQEEDPSIIRRSISLDLET
jgi:hypothetical protein